MKKYYLSGNTLSSAGKATSDKARQAVKIVIDDKKLRKLCEEPKEARKKLGTSAARKLRSRLSDLAAAASVFDLPPSVRGHALTGDRAGEYAVNLDRANRIVFESADDPIPKDENGGIDWSSVESVRITYIGNYHD